MATTVKNKTPATPTAKAKARNPQARNPQVSMALLPPLCIRSLADETDMELLLRMDLLSCALLFGGGGGGGGGGE